MEDYMMEKDIYRLLENVLENSDDLEEKIVVINKIKMILHQHSPFKNEPVDCVIWVKEENIVANDYNPNIVAPAEMRLLQHSLSKDGFTQPIVVMDINGQYQIIDGFHRHELGKKLRNALHGYLPVSRINPGSQDETDRVAMTIRHNRARGKHVISSMTEIVQELSRQGWKDSKIGLELGMDADEVLRLKQIGGLSELFSQTDFSNSWTVD